MYGSLSLRASVNYYTIIVVVRTCILCVTTVYIERLNNSRSSLKESLNTSDTTQEWRVPHLGACRSQHLPLYGIAIRAAGADVSAKGQIEPEHVALLRKLSKEHVVSSGDDAP